MDPERYRSRSLSCSRPDRRPRMRLQPAVPQPSAHAHRFSSALLPETALRPTDTLLGDREYFNGIQKTDGSGGVSNSRSPPDHSPEASCGVTRVRPVSRRLLRYLSSIYGHRRGCERGRGTVLDPVGVVTPGEYQ